MILQIAWRNVWRNPRRTVVILTAVVIGVWSMICLGALMRGIIDEMVRNGISTLTGHIQVQVKGYRNDPVIENSMADPEEVENLLKKTLPPGSLWTTRVRVNAVASNARHSAGVTLVGIDPEREARISFIGGTITKGRYITENDDHGIIIGQAFLEKFDTKLGHKLILMSQDTNNEIASRAFRIIGVFRAQFEATEKQFVFITRPAAQHMLHLKDDISLISILLLDRNQVESTAEDLKTALPANHVALTWQELLPMVVAYLNIYDGFIFLWYIVVFIAMGFGIVNTTLMAVYERMREFGLLKALGMKPALIIKEVLVEGFFLLTMGLIIGNILGFLSIFVLSGTGIDLSALAAGSEYFGISRIIYPALTARDVITADLVVFGLGLLVSVYPAIKAARFTPVEALAKT